MIGLGLVVAVLREAEQPQARYQRRTGRPVGGFGSLRATGSERAGSGAGRAASGRSGSGRFGTSTIGSGMGGSRRGIGPGLTGSPLVGGTAKRPRKRRPSSS